MGAGRPGALQKGGVSPAGESRLAPRLSSALQICVYRPEPLGFTDKSNFRHCIIPPSGYKLLYVGTKASASQWDQRPLKARGVFISTLTWLVHLAWTNYVR